MGGRGMSPGSHDAILGYLAGRVAASAAAIGEGCGMGPGEVRAHPAHLESLRHVVSRPDGLAKPPCRVFLVTAEGRRRIEV